MGTEAARASGRAARLVLRLHASTHGAVDVVRNAVDEPSQLTDVLVVCSAGVTRKRGAEM